MERYKKERKGSQELEEYIKTLLDNEVKPHWPKGWMQSRYATLMHHKNLIFKKYTSLPDCTCILCCFRVLMRESRNILSLFTSLP